MLTLRYSRFAFVFAGALLVVAPVASAFVCGSPAEHCCSSARIDHARLSSQSAPIAAVAAAPASNGFALVTSSAPLTPDSTDTVDLSPRTPLRI